jgi:hypothetical protein
MGAKLFRSVGRSFLALRHTTRPCLLYYYICGRHIIPTSIIITLELSLSLPTVERETRETSGVDTSKYYEKTNRGYRQANLTTILS